MKTKAEIVNNWLVRYTGMPLKHFGKYILLTNFDKYVKTFAEIEECKLMGEDKNMLSATSRDITHHQFWNGKPECSDDYGPSLSDSSKSCPFFREVWWIKKENLYW